MSKEHVYSAKDIAEWFVNRAAMESEQYGIKNNFSPLKLQKILYYAQACQLALKNKKLFKEKIEAWDYGPVVADVYRQYLSCGSNGISPAYLPEIDDETALLLESVFEYFGKFEARYLVDLTHQEEAYLDAYVPNQMHTVMDDEKIKKCSYAQDVKKLMEENKEEFLSNIETLNIFADKEIMEEIRKPEEQYKEESVDLEDLWHIE